MDYGVAGTALTSGILFGYVLEQAGFGSPCKLTAKFRLTDWSVFKVMFTAILVAAFGILLLQSGNYFGSSGFFVPTTFFWATALGAALIGAGFAVGGYCPGTSVVGFMSGRIDGLVFMLGMVLGILGFAAVYDAPLTQTILHTAQIGAKTLPQWLGVSPWFVLSAMVILAVGGFVLGRMMEQRSHGVLTAADIVEGVDPTIESSEKGSAVHGNLGVGSVSHTRAV
ncbi:MAG: hypothetical protein B7Z82_04100 [Halothiobacillus sp. 20-54-6]|nr:MAG: hypothetical protein B7Z82_04100 [Halothiobacillus sp. 20-54-6]